LTTLAVATLWNLLLNPRLLHRVGKALDGGYFGPDGRCHRKYAAAYCDPAKVNCACAASANSAAEFGACHAQVFAEDPEQRLIGLGIYRVALTVDL